MIWPAALPGAALRVMRTAVARRALQVALLVGGLFALGFLCGEQAHAAEGPPAASARTAGPLAEVQGVRADGVRLNGVRLDSVRPLTEHTVDRIAQPHATPIADRPMLPAASTAPQSVPPSVPRPDTPAKPWPTAPAKPSPRHPAKPRPTNVAGPKPTNPVGPKPAGPATSPARRTHPSTDPLTLPGTGDQVLGSVAGGLLQGVGVHVVRRVGGLVVAVTGELGKATAQIPPLSSLPALPIVPTEPGAPSLPGLPGLPGLPSLPSPPGLPTVPGQTPPLPVPQPGGGAGQSAAGEDSAEGRSGAPVRGTSYGPMPGMDAGAAHASVHGEGRRSAASGYVPVQQAPGGDPTGELSSRNAVDNGTSRHGDAHAVALNQRAPSRLLAGAPVRADVDSTRDRHRDIPVSPA